jgi:hypothetical protein
VKATRIVPFDVNGSRLGPGFEVGAEVRGIAVDEDRRVWTADAASASLRAFTAFGAEVAALRGSGDPDSDRHWSFGDPAGIAAQGVEAEARLLVSRRGARRHALLLVEPAGGAIRSLIPDGDPQAVYSGLGGVALSSRFAYACEPAKGSVQVFRDGDFHFRISMPRPRHGLPPFEPCGIAALEDGRSVVACRGGGEGAVFLFDAGGSLVRCIAGSEPAGGDTGDVEDPTAVVVQDEGGERSSLALVLDRGGERIQAFTLGGDCLGAFHDLDLDAENVAPTGRRATSAPG